MLRLVMPSPQEGGKVEANALLVRLRVVIDVKLPHSGGRVPVARGSR